MTAGVTLARETPATHGRLTDLDRAWSIPRSGARLTAVRAAAEALHDRFARGPRVIAARVFDQARYLVPTAHALGGAASVLSRHLLVTHRAVLVQFLERGRLRSLLFDPTDVVAAREAPAFHRAIRRLGEPLALSVLSRTAEPLESSLARIGVAPADIDYVAFDHFHGQDVRSLLGTRDGTFLPRFPRARLLAPRVDWDAWAEPHPLSRPWVIAEGRLGVPEDRVISTDGDLELGDGVWILRTPGRTAGHQSLFINTPSGVWGVSANGACADAWSPHESRIPGVRRHARRDDVDVIPRAGRSEHQADQYTSMVLERTLAGRLRRAPGVTQMLASSEVTRSFFALDVAPLDVRDELPSGALVTRPTRRR